MKKVKEGFFSPDEEVRRFRFATLHWLRRIGKEAPELLGWAKGAVEDEDIFSGLLELVSSQRARLRGPLVARGGIEPPPKPRISADDLLSFLQEQRMGHVPSRELRAKLRKGGKKWKDVERMAAKARKETEPFLAELAGRAVEVERAARQLSRSLIEPVGHRPFEEEIADCKQAIVAFLKRRNVREVNQYGWVLLRAIFGNKWKPGEGKDQIAAFRAIPRPFTGKIKTRKDAQIAMERAKLGRFRMLQKPEK